MPLQARKTVTEAVARLAAGLPRQEMVVRVTAPPLCSLRHRG